MPITIYVLPELVERPMITRWVIPISSSACVRCQTARPMAPRTQRLTPITKSRTPMVLRMAMLATTPTTTSTSTSRRMINWGSFGCAWTALSKVGER